MRFYTRIMLVVAAFVIVGCGRVDPADLSSSISDAEGEGSLYGNYELHGFYANPEKEYTAPEEAWFTGQVEEGRLVTLNESEEIPPIWEEELMVDIEELGIESATISTEVVDGYLSVNEEGFELDLVVVERIDDETNEVSINMQGDGRIPQEETFVVMDSGALAITIGNERFFPGDMLIGEGELILELGEGGETVLITFGPWQAELLPTDRPRPGS